MLSHFSELHVMCPSNVVMRLSNVMRLSIVVMCLSTDVMRLSNG